MDLVRIRSARAPQTPDGASDPGCEPASEPETGPRVYMETFGCQMNEADTALVLGRLRADGWRRVGDPGQADLIRVVPTIIPGVRCDQQQNE